VNHTETIATLDTSRATRWCDRHAFWLWWCASRSTISRISRRIAGRPARCAKVHRLATRRRCQRSNVAGVMMKDLQRSRDRHRLAAAPWGEPMYDPRLNLLALTYRILYAIVGGYITTSLAPRAPMHHVIMVGMLGFVAGTAGAIAAITLANLEPDWYPVALALSALPSVWLGGRVHRHRRSIAAM
jgi:hypothetical protein